MNYHDSGIAKHHLAEHQVTDNPMAKKAQKESPKGLVVVSVDNFDSGTFCFPPRNEPLVLPSVTVIDLARGTIHFSTLRS